MVVVVVPSSDVKYLGIRGHDPNSAQFLGYSEAPTESPHYPDSGCSSDGKECDSDICSNNSEGESGRLEDSGVYSADGDSLQLSSPTSFNNEDLHATKHSLHHHCVARDHRPRLTNGALEHYQHQLVSADKKRSQRQHDHYQPYIEAEPKTYPSVEAPLCSHCYKLDLSFFDPSCGNCWSLLKRPDVTPAHIFAVLRQWVPQVQRAVHLLVNMALTVGCGLYDRDSLTDMTLLHYAVKAGSTGVGDASISLQVVEELIDRGADVHQRCKWTHMTALHYAAYFDIVPVLKLLLSLPGGVNIDDPCAEYDLGTPLHMAAANLCLGAAHILLLNGASRTIRDAKGRTSRECIPSMDQYEQVPDVQELIAKFNYLLSGSCPYPQTQNNSSSPNTCSVSGKAVLQALGLKLGDRVLVNGVKTGSLRYIGPTEFATGLWAGVELETSTGRHNGCVKGVMYFRCGHNYGIFVPVNRLTKIPNVNGGGNYHTMGGRGRRRGRGPSVSQGRSSSRENTTRRSLSLPPGKVNHGRVDVSKVSSRIKQDINNTMRKLVIGDRVFVDMGMECAGSRAASGIVRYAGPVHFASGYWIGVDLDEPRGANDGKVHGTRYFACRNQHGVMAVPSRVIKICGDSENVSPAYDSNFEIIRQAPPKSISQNRETRSKSLGNERGGHSNVRSQSLNKSQNYSSPSRKHNKKNATPVTHNNAKLTPPHEIWDAKGNDILGVIKKSSQVKHAFFPPNTSMTNLNRSFSARYESARQRQEEFARKQEAVAKEPQWMEPPIISVPSRPARDEPSQKHWLEVGHNVFYKNMIGIIKYIGYVHFEEGKWLGIELRDRKGRHDGKVQGQRYFTCKSKHGLMVKPSKVTVRGINGAELVRPDEEEDVYYD